MEITYLVNQEKRSREIDRLMSLATHFWDASNKTDNLKRRKSLTRKAFDYNIAAVKLKNGVA